MISENADLGIPLDVDDPFQRSNPLRLVVDCGHDVIAAPCEDHRNDVGTAGAVHGGHTGHAGQTEAGQRLRFGLHQGDTRAIIRA